MTNFKFVVSDVEGAKETIKKIDAKFNANERANKILYREIEQDNHEEDIFSCEFIFPFPDLRIPAWIFLGINLIIFYFFRHLWIFAANLVLFFVAYKIKSMTSSKYYFKMLTKGMRKNGYKGKIERL